MYNQSHEVKYKNKVRCKKCNDILESKHVHDFAQCKCGAVFVDGGSNYQRIGFPEYPLEDWIEFIEERV